MEMIKNNNNEDIYIINIIYWAAFVILLISFLIFLVTVWLDWWGVAAIIYPVAIVIPGLIMLLCSPKILDSIFYNGVAK